MAGLTTAPPGRSGLSGSAPYRHLLDAFVGLSRADLATFLAELTAGVRSGRYPAGRPYRHVNGFTKVVAAEYECGARLTLHYWPADRHAPEDVSRPHDHRFAFTSVLLGGSQHFVELREVPADRAERWRRFTYSPHLAGRVAAVRGSGATGLQQVRTVRRQPLEGHYSTSSTVVHQAVTDRTAACATLVLRGPRERRFSHVYYRPAEPPPRGGIQLGRRLDHDTVVGQLDDVLAMMSAS